MKTVAQWAEYLPLNIKLCFIKECEKQKYLFETRYFSLRDAINLSLDYDFTEFGEHFWFGVWSLACDYKGREEQILTDLEWIGDAPYTKEEVEAMILEFADPNDEVCKVMLWNLAKPKEVTIDELYKANNDEADKWLKPEFYSPINGDLKDGLAKENEALKSTIEGLNAIVETQKVEIAQLKSAKDQLNWDMYPLHRQLNEAKVKLELAEKRIVELNKEINSSLFTRFLNLFK